MSEQSLPCGHPKQCMEVSAETGRDLYCGWCNAVDYQKDIIADKEQIIERQAAEIARLESEAKLGHDLFAAQLVRADAAEAEARQLREQLEVQIALRDSLAKEAGDLREQLAACERDADELRGTLREMVSMCETFDSDADRQEKAFARAAAAMSAKEDK